MRLASFSLIRNEAALAGAFCDQLLEFFDYPIVVDHSSSDNTFKILQSRLPSSNLFRMATNGYPQSEIATLFATAIFKNTDADYIFFLDCDEYLPFDNRSALHRALNEHNPVSHLYLRWRNLAPVSMNGDNIFQKEFYQASELSPYKKIILSRLQASNASGLIVEQGYHEIRGVKISEVAELSDKGLYHIPITSRSKFISKIINSAKRIQADNHLKSNRLGTHWLDLLDFAQASSLDDQTLIDLALSYPSPKKACGWLPLYFSFPYINAQYSETKTDLMLSFVPMTNSHLPDSPRHFNLLNNAGDRVFDSEMPAEHKQLEFYMAQIKPIEKTTLKPAENLPPMKQAPNSKSALKPASTALPSGLRINYETLVSPLFCLPQKMPPTAWFGHIPFLFTLIRLMQPKQFVELGVHLGASFIAACTAAKSFGLECNLAGVDTWEGDEHAGYYSGDDIYRDLSNYIRDNFKDGKLIRSTFQKSLDQFDDGTIDILHIDGLHTYEAVKKDYIQWLPKMRSDGVILFHDTEVHSGTFGVHQLWSEIATSNNSLNFPHSFGLGVLLLSPDSPRLAPLKPLLEDQDLREFYYQLTADVGETLPFRMGYVQLSSKGHASPFAISVRGSIANLLDAVRHSIKFRFEKSALRQIYASIRR